MNKIKILHVFRDDKFFESVSDFFMKFDYLDNIFAYLKINNNAFKYLKDNKLFIVKNRKDYYSLFHRPDIQIIFFHSLHPSFYKCFDYIDKNKIVIWWAWGYDIYNSLYKLNALIPIQLYKNKTKKYIEEIEKQSILSKIRNWITMPYWAYYRRKAVSRVDYFSPVIEEEYEMIKQRCSYFKAKLFMSGGPSLSVFAKPIQQKQNGNILVGNSLTWSNNYLDIIDYIDELSIEFGRKLVIPIAYGRDYGGRNEFKNLFKIKNKDCIYYLENFIPKEEYLLMFSSITHAIFGMMRQQAIGNINACFRNGIKVFFFKDSILYKHFKSLGFVVFTIEDDLNSDSINSVLSNSEIENNINLINKLMSNRMSILDIKDFLLIDFYEKT